MKIKKMVGEIFDLPANIELASEGVELINENAEKKYYRFTKAGSFTHNHDSFVFEFEVHEKKKQVHVEMSKEICFSRGALFTIGFPRKISRFKVMVNGKEVISRDKLYVDRAEFRVDSTHLSEENIVDVSFDGLPSERSVVKSAFKTKDASKILRRDGDKIIIDRSHMVKGDLIRVDNILFSDNVVSPPSRVVEVKRKNKVVSYMEL